MQRPNFLIIGVAKAGTTSLYHYIRDHPEVYLSPTKEPCFFAHEEKTAERQPDKVVTTLDAYGALFDGVTTETAVGEASPVYFHSPLAPPRIKQHLPEARLVALLRHPVERAYSHYMMLLEAGVIPVRDFETAFREDMRSAGTATGAEHNAFRQSYYADSLARYLELFDRSQLRVYLFETLVADPHAVLRDLFAFLDVDPDYVPEAFGRHNVSHGLPRSKALHRLIFRANPVKALARSLLPETVRRWGTRRIVHGNRTRKQALTAAVRREFMAVYRDDAARVERLLDLDLSPWRT